MSRDWTGQRERGSKGALRLICWIALRLGRPAARLLLYPITAYFLLRAGTSRRSSRSYLRRVLGPAAGLAAVARHFHSFAAVLLDRVFLLSDRFEEFEIRIHNPEVFLHEVERGSGALLLGAHLGSFDLLRALAVGRHEFPVKVLMYPAHNGVIVGLLDALSPRVAEGVIPLGRPDTMLRVQEAVDCGSLVGILGDRVAESEKSVACRFLGERALFPAGPMLLAAALDRPVIFFAGLYRGGNVYDVYFERLAERVEIARSTRRQDLERWTQRYADRLEHYVRQAPYNWFNFYDFWPPRESVK